MISWKQLKDNWNRPRKPSRWNKDYVLKNEWVVCLIPISNVIPVLFVIGILESIIILCSSCNSINLPVSTFYVFIGGIVAWIYIFMSKILFIFLKGADLLIYQPKQKPDDI